MSTLGEIFFQPAGCSGSVVRLHVPPQFQVPQGVGVLSSSSVCSCPRHASQLNCTEAQAKIREGWGGGKDADWNMYFLESGSQVFAYHCLSLKSHTGTAKDYVVVVRVGGVTGSSDASRYGAVLPQKQYGRATRYGRSTWQKKKITREELEQGYSKRVTVVLLPTNTSTA